MAGIDKRFGATQALADVNLEFFGGEVVGLLGENGAGKSTLLRILAGDHQPDSGVIVMDGEETTIRSPHHAHELGIYVVYQEPELALPLTVAENVLMGADWKKGHFTTVGQFIVEARELIRQQGFQDILDPAERVENCSPAQRQCIEILKAVRSNVRLLCLDEPTSSLSDTETSHLWAAIERLRSGGTAVVYVSHRMAEIKTICDASIIMRDGRVVGRYPAGELTEQEMVALMVGRPLSRFFPNRSTNDDGSSRVALRVRGVTTSSVTDVSFDLRAGEILGIAGLVGSGRTELARAICGVDRIHSGVVEVDGKEVRLRSPRDAIRAGICLAPEDRRGEALILARSIVENVSLPSLPRLTRAHFVRRGAERALVRDVTTRMRVKASALGAPVSTLSGGNQQKVVIARWVTMRPKVFVLDEPTRGIDIGAKVEIYDLMNELAQQGVGVILISSELPELIGLADRILVMRGGQARGEFRADEATEESILTVAFGDEVTA